MDENIIDENGIDMEISKYNIEENFKILEECKKELELIKRAKELIGEEENE